MKVKLHTSISGAFGSFSPGEKELPDVLALEMIHAGHADPLDAGEPAWDEGQTSPEKRPDAGEPVAEKKSKKRGSR